MPNYVPGSGKYGAKLMIVAEAPGHKEDELQKTLVGPTGQMLDEMLEVAGTHRSETYATNVVKYRPPFNDFTKLHLIGVDLEESINKLWAEEIKKQQPNVILCMGDQALRAVTGLTGITNYRGSILLSKDGVHKVVPTIHLAALFPKPGTDSAPLPWVYKKLIQHDIDRAVEESLSPNLNLPSRTHDIARNSLDVFRFKTEYNRLSKACVDIESINCIPVSIAFAFNKHHSLTIPLLRKIGNHYLTDMSLRELVDCWKFVAEMLWEKDLIGQNFKYDEYKLQLIRFRIRKVISDTMLKTGIIFPEIPDRKLNTQTSIWTREPFYKDEGKEAKIGTKFNVDKYFRYNGKDAATNFEVDEEQEKDLEALGEHFKVDLKSFYYNYVMRKHKFYLKMENNGFRIDFDKKKELKTTYELMWKSIHDKQADRIGYEVNVKSTPQMYRLLYEAMKFPKRKKAPTSEDTIVALLANHCKSPKDGKEKASILTGILEERRVRDVLSRAINFVPDYDERCKTSFKIEGTETARSTTNILKKPVRPKKIGLAFHTIPKHGRLAKDVRSMLIPDEGKVFLQGDLSQAEARIVAVLAEDYELLKAFDQIDIHRRTAALFFGYSTSLNLRAIHLPIIDDLAKDGPERFTGKMFRHAGNYDMGKRRAMNEFNVNAQKYEITMSISEWCAGQYIDLFHQASPKIRGVFHKGIRTALDNTRSLVNPYGRPRIFHGRWEDDLYKEGFAYIPQSTVADTTQSAAIDMDDEFNGDAEVMFLSENHDALVIQVPANNWEPYAKVMKKHMTRVIDFNTHCSLRRDYKLIIPVDIEISMDLKTGRITNYAELNKVKVAA